MTIITKRNFRFYKTRTEWACFDINPIRCKLNKTNVEANLKTFIENVNTEDFDLKDKLLE